MLQFGKYIFRAYCKLYFRKIELTHLGTNYGGWKLPSVLIPKLNILLSAGVGTDMSFEEDLIKETSSTVVHLFDPTPIAISHFTSYVKGCKKNEPLLINNGKSKHPNDPDNQRYKGLEAEELSRLNFHELGWDKEDTILKLFKPKHDGMVSFSSEFKSEEYVECPCSPVSSIIKQLRIAPKTISGIKMDIEGSEYGVIEDLNKSKITPVILMFEIHVFNWKNFWQILKCCIHLWRNSYKCYFMEGDNYGFIKDK